MGTESCAATASRYAIRGVCLTVSKSDVRSAALAEVCALLIAVLVVSVCFAQVKTTGAKFGNRGDLQKPRVIGLWVHEVKEKS